MAYVCFEADVYSKGNTFMYIFTQAHTHILCIYIHVYPPSKVLGKLDQIFVSLERSVGVEVKNFHFSLYCIDLYLSLSNNPTLFS